MSYTYKDAIETAYKYLNLDKDKVKIIENTNKRGIIYEFNGKTLKNNICRMSNDRAKKVFPHMAQGSKYMDLPSEIRQILPFREDIFPDRLKRLVLNEPSWTVIAHIGMDGYMYIHPTENRTLSVREAARIQSFPDDYYFEGGRTAALLQIGNAVPPLMASAIAKELKKQLRSDIS